MPLKRGKSKKTVSENISEEMHEYERTGRIGRSKPPSKKKAQKQAVAIALSEARRSGAKIPKKGKGKSTTGLTGKSPSRSKSTSARKKSATSSSNGTSRSGTTRKRASRSTSKRSSASSSRRKTTRTGTTARKSAARKPSSSRRSRAKSSKA